MTDVVAALICEKGKFLICQRPETKKRGLLWEFVGGKVEPGETKEEALARECREELDICVEVDAPYMEVVHSYPDLTVRLSVFHSHIKSGHITLLEHRDFKWITPEEIASYQFCDADEAILQKIKEDSKTGKE